MDMHGQILGVVSWSPPTEPQSFNFMTATSSVREMLASQGVANRLSATDQAYRAGLADFFAGKYHAAAKMFNTVLAYEPDHAAAQDYQRQAIANYPKEKTTSSSTLLFVLIGAGAPLLLGAGGVFLLTRKRRRAPSGTGALVVATAYTVEAAPPVAPSPTPQPWAPQPGPAPVVIESPPPVAAPPEPAPAWPVMQVPQPAAPAPAAELAEPSGGVTTPAQAGGFCELRRTARDRRTLLRLVPLPFREGGSPQRRRPLSN